jgi:hypothetical protein
MPQKTPIMVMVVIAFSKLQISQAFRLSISIRPSCARSSACSQAALESPRRWFALLLLLHRTRSPRRKLQQFSPRRRPSIQESGAAALKLPGVVCPTFSLEIKTQPNTAKPFAGYSNLLWIDVTFPAGTKMDPAAIAILTAEKVAPSSTLLSGNVTNGSIAYLTDKVVSRDYKKCDMESMDA